jgi:hypothetical protein
MLESYRSEYTLPVLLASNHNHKKNSAQQGSNVCYCTLWNNMRAQSEDSVVSYSGHGIGGNAA